MTTISIYSDQKGSGGKTLAKRVNVSDVVGLKSALEGINPIAPEWNPWWSAHVWRTNRRKDSEWESSGVICFDLDNEPRPGTHEAISDEIIECVKNNPPTCGNLWHFSPRGMRIIFLLKEQCSDRDLYLMAAFGAESLVENWLESVPDLQALRVDSKVFKDCARLVYPPNGRINGEMRQSAVFTVFDNPYDIEALADLAEQSKPTQQAIVAATPLRLPAYDGDGDFQKAVEKYNAENARDWGASGSGRCPAHPDTGKACFGRLRDSADKWCCFSSHHPDGCGRKSEDGTYYTGDAADIDAYTHGISVLELVLGKKPEPKAEDSAATLAAINAWANEPEEQQQVDVPAEQGAIEYVKYPGMESQAVDFAEKILAQNGCYVRGGTCVRVDGSAIIRVNRDDAPYLVGKFIKWLRPTAKGELVPWDPTDAFSRQVIGRSVFRHMKRLEFVSTVPVLLRDGTWVDHPGYDEKTGIYFAPQRDWGKMPEATTLEQAMSAKEKIFSLIQDFPFKEEVDRSVFLAALITPICKQLYTGNTPAFVFTSTTPGSGKTLLVQLISLIITGAKIPVSQLNKDASELQKELLSALISGVPMRLFDNIIGEIKSAPLEAILTSGGLFTGRLLGKSQDATLPVSTVFYLTGNNMQLGGDLYRRVVQCELAPMMESPETRTDFAINEIEDYVKDNQIELYKSAASIIQAWINRGSPRSRAAFGSFEQWSIVSDIIVMLGEPSPIRRVASVSAQTEYDAVLMLFDGIKRLYEYEPFTLFQLASRVNASIEAHGEEEMPAPEASILQAAQTAGCVRSAGRDLAVDTVKVGHFFRRIEGRIFDNACLKRAGRTRENKTQWTLVQMH